MFTQWQTDNADDDSSRTHSPQPSATAPDHDIRKPADASQSKPHTPVYPQKSLESTQDPNLDPKLSLDSTNQREHSFPSTFDSDKKEPLSSSLGGFQARSSTLDIQTIQPSRSPMPHRVDTYPMTSSNRRQYEGAHRRPSPPPIATLTHSPSLSVSSLDRSSVSTPPPPRRSPPHSMHPGSMYSSPYHSEAQLLNSTRPHQNAHFSVRGTQMTSNYAYSHPSFDHQYESTDSGHNSPYQMHNSLSGSHMTVPNSIHGPASGRESYSLPYPLPGQVTHTIIHTDDAATKLSDRVRRRCFNCCTTDTSTWRRSNLSPGKVLCNKCGLFERTHSRPRPEQFPHKRGPLATSTLRSRSPQSTQLPPIATHSLPPYHYNHPSIAPISSAPDSRRQYHSNTLPEIQSWLPDGPAQSMPPPTARRTLEPSPRGRPASPPPSARVQSSSIPSPRQSLP